MLKRLKLRTKVLLGTMISTIFLLIAVIVIYVFLQQVNTSADTLEEAYLSVIDNSSDIESNTYDLMFDMRGYNFTGYELFLDDANENLNNLKSEINQVKTLSQEQPSLVELKDLIDEIEEEVTAFESLMAQSKTVFDKIELNRQESDQRAQELFDVLDQFTEEQESELMVLIEQDSDGSDIETQYRRMTVVDEISDIVNEVVTSALESQLNDDYSLLDEKLLTLSEARSLLETAKSITTEADDLANLDTIAEDLTAYESDINSLIEANDEIDAIKASIEQDSLNLIGIASLLFDDGLSDADAAMEEINADISVSITILLIGIGLGIAVSIGANVVIGSSIVRAVNNINFMLRDISEGEGDLTKRLQIDSQDEFGVMGNLFNDFIMKLQELIKGIALNATSLASSSTQISSSIENSNESLDTINVKTSEISESTTQNASLLEETNASIEEIASSASLISEKATEATQYSLDALRATESGSQNLNNVNDSVLKVQDTSIEMEKVIKGLNSSSNEIGGIIDIITSISEQVNLLALNAAIEAARAGEHGKGFAVVADEVRKLAEETKVSADSIRNLVGSLIEESNNALMAVESERNQVSESVSNIDKTSQEFSSILEKINGVAELMDNISQMVDNQTAVTDDIAKSIGDITSSTVESASSLNSIATNIESQAAVFEEITASVVELSSTAEGLQNETDRFIV